MTWRDDALCAGDDRAEAWFAHPTDTEGVAYALAVCERCPVRRTCAEYALENRIADGLWGGLTETQRQSIRRRESRLAAKP